jgi:predicted acyl esterase
VVIGKNYDIVYPNATAPGVNLEKNVYATMRDGVRIALDIYKPSQIKAPCPVILAYSAFPKERIFESAKPGFYCLNGYICVQASERGIGINEGQFTFQGPTSALDGFDIVEWIAQQPWCNGNVSMMGASGYGVMQWKTAIMNPPHLKALVVLGATDNYRGLCYPGGVLRKPFVLNLVSGLTLGAIWPGPIPGKQSPVNIISDILTNNMDGPYWWEHGGSWKNISQIKSPVLNIVQTPNRLHAVSHLSSYADIRSPKKLILTPWTNENYQPWIFETIAFNQHILRWLDYWLKGIETGIMNEPEIAIYDNGTGGWHYESEYPLARTQWNKFYLHGIPSIGEKYGVINTILPGEKEKPDIYHNISLNTALKDSYGITDNQLQSINSRQLVYLTPALDDDLRVWGPISLNLFASTTEEITSDWSFFIKMGEMVPEGLPLNPVTGKPEIKPEINDPFTPPEVQIWSWGSLKCKFRDVDISLSKPGNPWHSFQRPEDLQPNTVYEFLIELQPIFKTFRKGCRIWLKIASDDALYTTRDASSQYVETPLKPVKDEISVYHSADYPSFLLLPVISEEPRVFSVQAPLLKAVPDAPRIK